MGDINRVFAQIDGFFEAGGQDFHEALVKVLRHEIFCAKQSYINQDLDEESVKELIDAAEEFLKNLAANLPEEVEALKKQFCEAATKAMIARRGILPLPHPEYAWKTRDPREALFDDDDMHSFAVYDTLADQIAPLLPALHQIAVESSWQGSNDKPK